MVSGETAFRSASSGRASPAAAITSSSTSSAAPGGQMITTTSAVVTASASVGSRSSPCARPRVRSDRPSTVATTRAPPATHARPSAEPMAPGDTIPIVVIGPP